MLAGSYLRKKLRESQQLGTRQKASALAITVKLVATLPARPFLAYWRGLVAGEANCYAGEIVKANEEKDQPFPRVIHQLCRSNAQSLPVSSDSLSLVLFNTPTIQPHNVPLTQSTVYRYT